MRSIQLGYRVEDNGLNYSLANCPAAKLFLYANCRSADSRTREFPQRLAVNDNKKTAGTFWLLLQPSSLKPFSSNVRPISATSGQNPSRKRDCPFSPRSGQVEAIQIHHLAPCRHEVFHKLLL
jgi:hypothetical protein